MSSTVEVKASNCPKCSATFDAEKVIPIVFSCGHGVCIGCNQNSENEMVNCPTCEQPIVTRAKNYAFVETLKMMVHVHKKIEELKDPKVNHQCSSCNKWTLEKNLHICKNCVLDKNEPDMTGVPEEERAKKVVEIAMCSNCIVPKHSYKGHTLVSMFPTWNFYNLPSYLSIIESKWEVIKYGLYLLEPTFFKFKEMSNEVFKTRDLMLGMARKSTSKEEHSEIIDKLEKFIDEVILIYVGTDEEMRRRTTNVEITSCISPPSSPTIESKLNEFKNAFNSLRNNYTQQAEIIAKNFNKFIDLARNSENVEKREEVFDKMDDFVDETSPIYDELKVVLEKRAKLVEESIKQVNQWCETEINFSLFTEEKKKMELKLSEDSDDDDDDFYLIKSFKEFYV